MAETELTFNQFKPRQGEWTYQDYLNLPDDGRRYEIIQGVLYVTNAPGYEHQFAVFELARQLGNHVVKNELGQILTAPFEIHLSETTRPVQPDVFFIKTERLPKTDISYFEGPPDLVVEVLSPSSIRTDQHVKFSAYEQAGVPEYWIVNPKTRSVELFTLSGGEYALLGQYAKDELIESKVLAGLQIVTASLFTSKS